MNCKIAFLSLLLTSATLSFAIENDSISTLNKNGQTVILYEVGAKETMYSIARKYNIPPKSIIAINPEIANTGLKTGQKIFVPYETARLAKTIATSNTGEIAGATYHTVEKSQTLYTVARMYKTSVEDLRRWNNLVDSDLKIGSKLIVNMNAEVVKQVPFEVLKETSKKTVRSNTGYDKIVETGKAEAFDTNEGDKYYYVLHKTLSIGTVVQVENEANGITIYGRVVGKLPESADKNMILKLSKLAYAKLGGESASIKVQVAHLP